MIIRANILSGLLSSEKFVSTYLPFIGSAVLHATVFAAVVGFIGWGDKSAPRPEVVVIDLVQAENTALSKGQRELTDKKGSKAQKKQKQKKAKSKKLALLSSDRSASDKIISSAPKTIKDPDNANQKRKKRTRASQGSRRELKGAARRHITHGPRFSGRGLSNPRPRYPSSARSRGQQGRVVLRVRVSAGGKPLSVRVSKSSGVSSLDISAIKAVKRWKFHPARKNGRAVAGTVYTPITFRLVR